MNQELERLVDLALADGILSDKEKEVLYRKAIELDVDHEEFEMVLNAKFYLKSNEGKFQKTTAQKAGKINKCLSCGEVLDSFSSKCPSCDHEIRVKDSNKIISDIDKRLEFVKADFKERIANTNKKSDRDYLRVVEQRNAEQDVIRNIPVPATKEDLIEVISFCYPKIFGINHPGAYKAKYLECFAKLEMLAINDPSLLVIVNNFKSKVSSEEKKIRKMLAIIGIPVLVIIIIFIIITQKYL